MPAELKLEVFRVATEDIKDRGYEGCEDAYNIIKGLSHAGFRLKAEQIIDAHLSFEGSVFDMRFFRFGIWTPTEA